MNEPLLIAYADRILVVDIPVVVQWGDLPARLIGQGKKMRVTDGLITATALQHNFTLVTRNAADFSNAGISLVNPWAITLGRTGPAF